MLSKDKLFSLLSAKPDVVFDSEAPENPKHILLQSLIGSISGLLSYKIYEVNLSYIGLFLA
jgi:hypothetical protein